VDYAYNNLSIANYFQARESDEEIVHKGERNFSSGQKFPHTRKRKCDKTFVLSGRNI